MKRIVSGLLAALIAAPAVVQAAPPVPPPPAPHAGPGERQVIVVRERGEGRWAGVSPEGRAVLRGALSPADRQQDREAVRAVRNRINAIIAADRLDVNALRTAMAEERRLVDAMQGKRQEAMLAAIQKLSPADRKAFAAAADRGREQMSERAQQWREWARQYRGGRDLPPPPAPPVPPTPPVAPVPPRG